MKKLVSAVMWIFLLSVACVPQYSETNKQISGNLTDLDFVPADNSEYTVAVLTFENGEVHKLNLWRANHYCFKLNRLHVIYYDDVGIITKVEILE
jgi:hypothetical protein